ncbi:desmocollin-1-like isoform X2 [Sphaerodactylus townsendi]|uniref:desmocollin-1-like isoform X2 n=1 Tax=Sphaerodactylus townsendi TaxID=933632 RepID=UPI0020275AD8|nr:desmocollin-1-like isoform X2 [Sphaerodactylus townsendi]
MAPLAAARLGGSSSRAACLQLAISLLVLSLYCEACRKVTFNLPSKLEAGALIGKVNLKLCLRTSDLITSSDPDFRVLEDGSLFSTNAISLSSAGRNFTILLTDSQKKIQKQVPVILQSNLKKATEKGEIVLRRSKRRWAPVPTIIMENSLGPFPMQIQQLFSDTAQNYNITYSISGPGVDQPPLNYFYIERETGNLFVTGPIDREEYPEFKIICYARTLDGYTPERPLVHVIRIEDDNDNPPVFNPAVCTFQVYENSRSGTVIGEMTATDGDEIGTLHTKLKYRIINQNPVSSKFPTMFNIDPDSGVITLASPGLDREDVEQYVLLIEARDMAGQPFGLCTTGTAVIELQDRNDHAPMCDKSLYEVFIPENTVGAKVIEIGAVDRDLPETSAWHATFKIIKGNEDGAFSIETNPRSNIGTLCVDKGLDYEKTKERRLEISVTNDEPYVLPPNSRTVSQGSCVVVVKVRDIDEGPVFDPCVYILNIKECLPGGTMVGHYLAKDPETRNSEDIRYGVLQDPCGWITMDERGEIRTTKLLDRDAPNMQNYQCNVTVSATDRSGKTGTGVIVVNLEDENDNFPVIVQREKIMCRDRKPICLTAVDADLPPNTVPFTFEITDRNLEWKLIGNDEKSVFLEPVNHIPYGVYDIPIMVTDNGGKQGITVVRVLVCDCTTPSDCIGALPDRNIEPETGIYQSPNVTLGLWAILAMILGSLLLLLILITLCGCCGAAPVSSKHVCDDLANQNLIISNTEAPGEEVMDPNILPLKTGNVVTSDQGAGFGMKAGGQESFEMVKGGGHQTMDSLEGGGLHTLQSVKGHHTLESGRGYGHPMMDAYRYSYSEWQNFTHPRLTEEPIRGHTLIKN